MECKGGFAMARATIGKWGNASAIRIPKPFCDSLRIDVGDDVRISIEDDRRIVIEPAVDKFTLKARMKHWNGERYKSEELDWGCPAGEEIW